MNEFKAYGRIDAADDVRLDRGVRIRQGGVCPLATGGVRGIGRSASHRSAS
jgi:hypothetical protein